MSTYVWSSGSIVVRPRVPEQLREKLCLGPWVVDDENDREDAKVKDDESVLGLVGDHEIAYGCYHFAPDALARILSVYLLPNGYSVNGYASIGADDFGEEYEFKVSEGRIEWSIRRLQEDALKRHLRHKGMDEDEIFEALIDRTGFDEKWYEYTVKTTPSIRESNMLADSLNAAKEGFRKGLTGKKLGAMISGYIRDGLETAAIEFWTNHGNALKKLSIEDWVDYLAYVDLGDSRIPLPRQLCRWGAEVIPATKILDSSKYRAKLTGSGMVLLMTQNFEQDFNRKKDAKKLSGAEWTYLLRMSDDFDELFRELANYEPDAVPYDKFSGCQALKSRDWSSLLALRPELASNCILCDGGCFWNCQWWGKLDEDDWRYLLAAEPQLREYRPKLRRHRPAVIVPEIVQSE